MTVHTPYSEIASLEPRKEKLTKKKKNTQVYTDRYIAEEKKRPRRKSSKAEKKFYVHFLWRRKFRVLHPSRYPGAVNTRELSNPGIILNKRLVFEENLSGILHKRSDTMLRVRRGEPFLCVGLTFCMGVSNVSGSFKGLSKSYVSVIWIGGYFFM